MKGWFLEKLWSHSIGEKKHQNSASNKLIRVTFQLQKGNKGGILSVTQFLLALTKG